MPSVLRKHSISILVAGLTALLVGGPAALLPGDGSKGSVASAQTTVSNCPAPTVSNSPCIKYGFKDGPVPLPGTPTTIAALPLGKGKYVINAKLYVQNYRGYTTLSMPAACQLVAGPNFDWAKQSIPPTNTNGIQQDPRHHAESHRRQHVHHRRNRRAQVQRRNLFWRPWCLGSLHQDHRGEGWDADQGEYVTLRPDLHRPERLHVASTPKPESSTHRVERGGKPKRRRSRLTGFASHTNVPGPGHRLCFSTDTWATAPPRGDRRSKSSATSSPWWCGTRPARAVPRTHLNRSCIAGYADCLAGFVAELHLSKPHVAGLSFGGILALEFIHRHPAIPMTLIPASAYAGWLGSLSADAADHRLQQALELADLSPAEFVRTLLPTMFSSRPHRRPLKRSA